MTILRSLLFLLIIAASLSAGEAKPTGLDAKLSFDFQSTRLEDLITFLGKASGLTITTAPSVTQRGPQLSLKAKDMTARNVLVWATELTGTTWKEQDGGIQISERTGKATASVPEKPIPPDIQKQLDQKMTLDFNDRGLAGVASVVSQLTGLNVVVSTRLLETKAKVTLKVTGSPLATVLDQLAKSAGAVWLVRDQAVFIDLPEAPATKPK